MQIYSCAFECINIELIHTKGIKSYGRGCFMRALSLFSNIGVAEAYLEELGVHVVLANEIDNKRVDIYKHIYPQTEVVCGDITDEAIYNEIITKAHAMGIDVIIATPPCQGMSTAGKLDEYDVRNQLIYHAVRVAKKLMPKYILFENVPLQLRTKIDYSGKRIPIPEFLKFELADIYHFEDNVINTADYGVPQTRERAIFLLTRLDVEKEWKFPEKVNKITTLHDAIGHLPQ